LSTPAAIPCLSGEGQLKGDEQLKAELSIDSDGIYLFLTHHKKSANVQILLFQYSMLDNITIIKVS